MTFRHPLFSPVLKTSMEIPHPSPTNIILPASHNKPQEIEAGAIAKPVVPIFAFVALIFSIFALELGIICPMVIKTGPLFIALLRGGGLALGVSSCGFLVRFKSVVLMRKCR